MREKLMESGLILDSDCTGDAHVKLRLDAERKRARREGWRFKSGRRSVRFDGVETYITCWTMRKVMEAGDDDGPAELRKLLTV